MNRTVTLALGLSTLLLGAACSKEQPAPTATPASSAPGSSAAASPSASAAPTLPAATAKPVEATDVVDETPDPEGLPLPSEHISKAEKEITDTNFKAELDRVEKEIGK